MCATGLVSCLGVLSILNCPRSPLAITAAEPDGGKLALTKNVSLVRTRVSTLQDRRLWESRLMQSLLGASRTHLRVSCKGISKGTLPCQLNVWLRSDKLERNEQRGFQWECMDLHGFGVSPPGQCFVRPPRPEHTLQLQVMIH